MGTKESTNSPPPNRRLSPEMLCLLLLLAIALICFCSWIASPREPKFHDRSISEWLANYPQLKQRDWHECEAAMRAFGTNNIPRILHAFREDLTWPQAVHNRLWYYGPVWLRRMIGAPKLRQFDTSYAPEIFAAIGSGSIPALTEALKERDPTVQMAASRALAYFAAQSKGALPEMHRCLSAAPINSRLYLVLIDSIKDIERHLPP